MTLASGSRLGGYEIVAPIGAGGMGEVFRAKDTRLNREVAIKVLPAAFAEDKERVLRFRREAQLVASLNHPNVAAIYGIEESGATVALVLELVEGEDLQARLARGPMALDEALAIARQIAEGLEAAHEKGIVHRDLKPANVKVTRDGVVKILDFGLAKAFAAEGARSEGDLSQSPTMSRHMTEAGMVLGTAAYMSPEQARGREVDKRTDIWALGGVLWEMLTGRRLFAGETVTDVLAAVLTREVDWSALPKSTPEELRRLLRRMLERNPKNRLHDVADARIALAELERGGPATEPAAVARSSRERPASRVLRWLGPALLAALAALAVARPWRKAPASGLATFRRLTNDAGVVYSARFAPDGASVVYGEASGSGPVNLFSTPVTSASPRRFDWPSADVVGIAGNGDAALILGRTYQGTWLRKGTLAQANLAGGAPRALLENVYDADISRDGTRFAVVRADRNGGQVLESPAGTALHRTIGWISAPRFSPDGRRIAFADHPLLGDDQGYITVLEPGRPAKRISKLLNFLHGLAWTADGREVYASFGDIDRGTTIAAFSESTAPREVLNSVSLVRLQDVAPNGRLLISNDTMQVATQGHLGGSGDGEYLANWFGESVVGIARDGRLFGGSSGSLLGGSEYHAFYRLSDGSPPVSLGEGGACGITPDGRYVFVAMTSRDRSILRAEPTGPGETRRFDLGKIEIVPSSTGRVTANEDGTLVAFVGIEAGGAPRGYVFALDGKQPPRAVTPDGVRELRISPRGDAVVGVDAAGAIQVYPVSGGAPRAVAGALAGEIPVAWSGGGDAIFVWDRVLPARVQRLDLATGKRELAFEWKPKDPSAMLYGILTVTTDARYYLMRYRRSVSSLAVVDGVR